MQWRGQLLTVVSRAARRAISKVVSRAVRRAISKVVSRAIGKVVSRAVQERDRNRARPVARRAVSRAALISRVAAAVARLRSPIQVAEVVVRLRSPIQVVVLRLRSPIQVAEVLAAGLPHRRGLLLLVRHQAAQLLARANQPRPSCSSLSASRRVRLPCRPRGGHHVA